MDARQLRKFIALGILSIAAVLVLVWQLRPSEETRLYRENFAKSQQAPVTPAVTPPTGGAPQPAAPGAPSAPAPASQFKRANVDIEDLLAGVQRENFSYEEVRIQRNPMQPLVGNAAPPKYGTPGTDQPEELLASHITSALSSMKITSIIWDAIYPVAVINDEIVYNGFVFSDTGIRVAAIEPRRVIMQVNETQFPVELKE